MKQSWGWSSHDERLWDAEYIQEAAGECSGMDSVAEQRPTKRMLSN